MICKSVAAGALCALAWVNASAANSSYASVTGASKLEFTGIQAGAEFRGTFHAYTAAVDFDPAALDRARIDVQIQLASVDTLDKDRDQTIRGPGIFDLAHFPTAHYTTRNIVKSGSGYSAIGSLTLRGVTKDVPISFQWVPSANRPSSSARPSSSVWTLVPGKATGKVRNGSPTPSRSHSLSC